MISQINSSPNKEWGRSFLKWKECKEVGVLLQQIKKGAGSNFKKVLVTNQNIFSSINNSFHNKGTLIYLACCFCCIELNFRCSHYLQKETRKGSREVKQRGSYWHLEKKDIFEHKLPFYFNLTKISYTKDV